MPESGARGRILIIDDQEPTRYIFRHILTRAGYSVEEAVNGTQGLAMAMSLPDLIISDVNLPDMLGYDVCRRLRSNPLTVSIPVLQISASFVSDESMVQALDGGADSYLTQPVEPTVLLAQVSALLRLRRAEVLSSLSSRQWQTTFDGLSDGLALVDSDGNVLRVNRTFLESLILTASEIEGSSLASIFESRFEKKFSDFLKEGTAGSPVEVSWNSRWFRARFDKIQTDLPSSSGAVFLVTEITDHKKLLETVKMSERLAATGRLAHIIAHEINNPLEAMSNLLFLALQGTPAGDDVHAYLSMAASELVRISEITKQILAYHRESKMPVVANTGDLLEGTLAMFRSQMLSNKIEVVSDVRCNRPLKVYPGEIRQVFDNLISNSLDAMRGAGGRLIARCVESSDQHTGVKGVRFLFSDSGTGIPHPIVPRIFNAFYTTKETSGSGIGLWLTAEVVKKHGGTLRLRTRTEGPYRGTLIDLFIPDFAAHNSQTESSSYFCKLIDTSCLKRSSNSDNRSRD